MDIDTNRFAGPSDGFGLGKRGIDPRRIGEHEPYPAVALGDPVVVGPAKIAAEAGSEHVLVTDRTGDMAVSKVSAAGKVVGTLKRSSAGHVAVDGVGTVYLSQGDAVEVRDAKGETLRKFSQGNPARGKLSHAGPIAYDGRGHLFVHDGSSVLIFDAEGAFLASLDTGSLNDLALDRAGALYTLTADKVRKYEITLPKK
jgi:hypothetical protein